MILLSAYRRSPRAIPPDDRERLESVPEIAGVSAGGMPDRVKCLHALVAHPLAAGEGVNPLGDEASACWARSGLASVLGGGLVRRVAAIDCGTNSIRLLIAEPDGSRRSERIWSGGWRSYGSVRASMPRGEFRSRRFAAYVRGGRSSMRN